LVSYETNHFYEDEMSFVDPGVLQLFTFPLVKGDPDTVLAQKHSAVITEEMAEKYFGREDPLGKTLSLDFIVSTDVIVSGVIKNHPRTSNIAPDILVPIQTIEDLMPNSESFFQNWLSQQIQSYIMLPEDHSVPEIESKIMGVFKQHIRPQDQREK